MLRRSIDAIVAIGESWMRVL